jgi:hypothetical protein
MTAGDNVVSVGEDRIIEAERVDTRRDLADLLRRVRSSVSGVGFQVQGPDLLNLMLGGGLRGHRDALKMASERHLETALRSV